MEIPKVGGEVEAYCMTCKTMKWHVVVAVVDDKPAKVECHGCHKQHVFRLGPPGTTKPRPRRPRADEPAAPAPIDDLEQRLAAGERDALTYSPKDVYAVDQFVRHPTFGVGLVVALPAAQKVEVAFRSGRKLLVHQRGDGPITPTLVRPARRDDEAPRGVTDAPDRSRSGGGNQ
ncbi:MAG TPA: hypothetical protein VFF06_10000 [Polyangia bacterium]|nr:hypothetical protein [Polyangia bacterium]